MSLDLDVLLPCCGRPSSLAAVLAGLTAQTVHGFRLLLSDQTDGPPAYDDPAVRGVLRVLEHRGDVVEPTRHLPRRGIAEHRQHLLERSSASRVLYLDDDVLLDPTAVATLLDALEQTGAGFVGMAMQGLSYVGDERPHEQVAYEEWDGPVRPERVRKDVPAWERWRLHNAANLVHLDRRLGPHPRGWRAYKVAWLAGCVLFDRVALVEAGGFGFWRELPPESAGEDVVAQLRVLERRGGAGVLPSGAWHLELPTTIGDRRVDAYAEVLERADAVPGLVPGGDPPPRGSGVVDWITGSTRIGRTIASAIPPGYDAYATVVIPDGDSERTTADTALVDVLRAHCPAQPWWLGYLDTGVADVVAPDLGRVAVYVGWPYVLLEGGPEQALTARRNSDATPWHSALPELLFPADRSWLVSTMWDDAWRCVGGPAALVDALLRRPELEARAVTLDEDVTPPGHEDD